MQENATNYMINLTVVMLKLQLCLKRQGEVPVEKIYFPHIAEYNSNVRFLLLKMNQF